MKKNSSGNNAKLSIKSKLLFNNLDMLTKVVSDLTQSADKRQKSIDKILSTYRMTVRPFVEDESSDMPGNVIVKIQNSVGGSLPQTGGSGTMPFKVYGLTILALAGLVFVAFYMTSMI